jgi:hypothetical protein
MLELNLVPFSPVPFVYPNRARVLQRIQSLDTRLERAREWTTGQVQQYLSHFAKNQDKLQKKVYRIIRDDTQLLDLVEGIAKLPKF